MEDIKRTSRVWKILEGICVVNGTAGVWSLFYFALQFPRMRMLSMISWLSQGLWGKREFPEYIHYEIIPFLKREGEVKPVPDQYMDYFLYFALISHNVILRVRATRMKSFTSRNSTDHNAYIRCSADFINWQISHFGYNEDTGVSEMGKVLRFGITVAFLASPRPAHWFTPR